MLMVGMQCALISCFLEREIRADRCLGHFFPVAPLLLERVDVEFDVVERRMTRRQVLGFHHRAFFLIVLLPPTSTRARRAVACSGFAPRDSHGWMNRVAAAFTCSCMSGLPASCPRSSARCSSS